MEIKIHFKNLVIAQQAMNVAWLIGYWGYIENNSVSRKGPFILVTHSDAEGTIRLRFGDDIID